MAQTVVSREESSQAEENNESEQKFVLNTDGHEKKQEFCCRNQETTAYCRCWKSKKFPYCDGSHRKFNEETGSNVGPVIVKCVAPVKEVEEATGAEETQEKEEQAQPQEQKEEKEEENEAKKEEEVEKSEESNGYVLNTESQPARLEACCGNQETTAYCRCWKSQKFPYCDGSHRKFNEETGSNIGPVIVKCIAPVNEEEHQEKESQESAEESQEEEKGQSAKTEEEKPAASSRPAPVQEEVTKKTPPKTIRVPSDTIKKEIADHKNRKSGLSTAKIAGVAVVGLVSAGLAYYAWKNWNDGKN